MTGLPSIRDEFSGDLIQQANQFVLAVLFPSSKSAVFPLALNIARAASLYQEVNLEGRVFHVAGFEADIDSMKRALSLLSFARRIAHVQIYGRGQLITNPFRASSVVECYMNSLKPDDFRAHCHVMKRFRVDGGLSQLDWPSALDQNGASMALEIRTASDAQIEDFRHGLSSFIIPCGYITKYADFTLSSRLAGSFVDQIMAAGAKNSCDWCPNFTPKDLKKL